MSIISLISIILISTSPDQYWSCSGDLLISDFPDQSFSLLATDLGRYTTVGMAVAVAVGVAFGMAVGMTT